MTRLIKEKEIVVVVGDQYVSEYSVISDQDLTSPHNINTLYDRQVMRIKKVFTYEILY